MVGMRLSAYRAVLARPGVRSLLVISLLARVPVTAAPVVLTLHVVLDLHRGFGAAGSVAACSMIGAAIGAPFIGRGLDRYGLTPVLVLTTLIEAGFWALAVTLSYAWLLGTALVYGVMGLPVFTIVRQALAALVPPEERQAAFSLDSMSIEVSFAIGPALGVLVLTHAGSTTTLVLLAAAMLAAGAALLVLNPPMRGEEGAAPTARRRRSRRAEPAEPAPPWRSWFQLRILAVLLAAAGATMTLTGTDVAITATMRSFGQVSLLGIVVAVWAVASMIGGFVYGLLGRAVDSLVLLALLAGLTVIAAAAPNWVLLAVLVVPSGLFCAPLISATAAALTDRAPPAVRGQVLGLHASALTIGNGIGAPLVGLVVDRTTARTGFVAIGLLGLALAVVALAGLRYSSARRPTRNARSTSLVVNSNASS
jgi:MFS family permease